MQDTSLYQQILGIEDPWTVESVDLDTENKKVEVFLKHKEKVKWQCPKCDLQLSCRDHASERSWRHLDSCQFQTIISAKIPRVDCPEHGVLQASVPWAASKSRFTLLMERFAIDVLQHSQNTKAACLILNMSWDEAAGIMSRAVARGKARKDNKIVKNIGIDEKSFRSGHNSYMTLIYNLENSSVEYIADNRRTSSLDEYYESLTTEQINGIEAVSMDMWDPYLKSTKKHIPNANGKIVLDRFHLMKMVNHALDLVRRKEQNQLLGEERKILKGSRYALLFSEENLPKRYFPVLAAIKNSNLKVARAWAMKESIRHLWDYVSETWARKFFKQWYWWATHSRLTPMIKLARTLNAYLDYIVSYATHQINNAIAEGLNSKIQSIKRRACGFRNAENYKSAILFYCGKLDLYPR